VTRQRTSALSVTPPAAHPELWEAVNQLPRRQREVLALRVVLDLSQEQVAELLGIRPGTVSATLAAARARLVKVLDGEAPSAEREGGRRVGDR
jgi:DNA-directed RNA polymerase specialized sigma24 family protein